MKKIHKNLLVLNAVTIISVTCILSGCGGSSEKETAAATTEAVTTTAVETTTAPETVEETTIVAETEPVLEYFESDAIVNDFFVKYNEVTENPINAETITQGNIRTKAHTHTDEFSIEVINVSNETISISIGTEPDFEDTAMFTVFSDCFKALTTHTDDEIAEAWNAIHETGYLVEDYDFNGILITYVPSKELSWGISDPRVDVSFPVE